MYDDMIATTIRFAQEIVLLLGQDVVWEEMEIIGWRDHDINDIPGFIEDYITQIEVGGEGFIEGLDTVETDFRNIADKYGYSVDENLVVTDGVPR